MQSPFITVELILEIGKENIQRVDNAQVFRDDEEAHVTFICGSAFLSDAGYFLLRYQLREKILVCGVVHALEALSDLLESRSARPLLQLNLFMVVKNSTTRILARKHTTDVDRMNLTLCKRRAQGGLKEPTMISAWRNSFS